MYSLEDSRNRGFIARMQKQSRVPHMDKSFMENLAEMNISTERAMKHMTSWLGGWDEADLDYAKTPHHG